MDDMMEQIARARKLERGFDPDLPVHSWHVSFRKGDIQKSLFESSRHRPFPLMVDIDEDDNYISVILDLIRPVYPGDDRAGNYFPDWYLEGWLAQSDFDPADRRRVRMYIQRHKEDRGRRDLIPSDVVEWQVIEKVEPLPFGKGTSLQNIESPNSQWLRIRYQLRLGKIRTIGDLLDASPDKLLNIHGIGPRSLEIIREVLFDSIGDPPY